MYIKLIIRYITRRHLVEFCVCLKAVMHRFENQVKLLLKYGANADGCKRCVHGETPLHFAESDNSLTMVRTLLSGGARIDTNGGRYTTALARAAEKGKSDILQCMLKHIKDTGLSFYILLVCFTSKAVYIEGLMLKVC